MNNTVFYFLIGLFIIILMFFTVFALHLMDENKFKKPFKITWYASIFFSLLIIICSFYFSFDVNYFKIGILGLSAIYVVLVFVFSAIIIARKKIKKSIDFFIKKILSKISNKVKDYIVKFIFINLIILPFILNEFFFPEQHKHPLLIFLIIMAIAIWFIKEFYEVKS